MRKFTTTIATLGAFAVAGTGLAGTAAAEPTINGGSAADVVKALQDKGYTVQINGQANGMQLSRCTTTGIEGLNGTMTMASVMMMLMQPPEFDTVYVNVSCPASNN
jgi:hypothetical protein